MSTPLPVLTPRPRRSARLRALSAVVALLASFVVAIIAAASPAAATGSLSKGSLTMVSTRSDGTSGPATSSTDGADQEAISDDGKVIAFVSPIPADQLVTDPLQTGKVADTNNADDVFVWDSRVPSPAGPIVTLVSWNKQHTGTGDAGSQHPIMAPGGVGLTFESGADDLVTVPVGSFSKHLYAWVPLISDVFPVFMIDENYQGTSGSDSVSSDASIAITAAPPMARIAFTSSGSDLVDPNVANSHGLSQVYVRTYTLGSPTTQMASVDTTGNGTVSGAQDPMIAADAQHVVFDSGGDSLVNGVTATGGNIFIRNLATSKTTLVSKGNATSDGTTGNDNPVISADGSAVAWESNDPNLSATTHNGNNHVFYRSGSNPVQMIDTNFTGLLGCNGASDTVGLSLDGTTVDFQSICSDITTSAITDTASIDVFMRRMIPGVGSPMVAPQLVSVNDDGDHSGNGASFLCPGTDPPHCGASTNPGVTINADGTAITFFGGSSDIAKPPAGVPPFNDGDVFVRYPDLGASGKTVNVTVNGAGQNPDEGSRDPVISSDGGSVAFVSLADDLVTPDTNGMTDVFESDLHNSFYIQPVDAVHEGDGNAAITVGRTGNLGTQDTVKIATADGSVPALPTLPPEITNPANSNATEPSDYTKTEKTLTFAPGVQTQTFTVPIVNDTMHEDPELFHVSLSAASGAGSVPLPGPLSDAYVVILDDDPAPPSVTIDQASGQSDPTSTSPVQFTAVFSSNVTGFDGTDVDLSASTATGTLVASVTGGPKTYTIDVTGMTGDGTVVAKIAAGVAMDAGAQGNEASTSTDDSVTWQQPVVDTTKPDVTIDQAAAQADPTSTSPVQFTAVFSEPVSGFDGSDVDLSASTAGSLTAVVSGGPSVYTVDVTGMSVDGKVVVAIPAGGAHDAASNTNNASTSTDNSVTWQQPVVDTTKPDVTIDQAAAQADPTSTSPVQFTAVFSEPVSGFDGSDVDLSASTAGSLTAVVSGGPSIYTVDVTGMSVDGKVVVAIPAGGAHDAASNTNNASTSTDNSVTWQQPVVDTTKPDVTIDQAAAQADPTSTSPVQFTAVFSEPVSGFDGSDVDLSASTAGSLTAVVSGGPSVYTVDVTGMSVDGKVVVAIPAGGAHDAASNTNNASTSTDNSVAWQQPVVDTTKPDVTIDQAAAQADPTSTSPVQFTAVFSEPVSGFDGSDVDLSASTAGSLTAVVGGGPMTYTVTVTGMSSNGKVIAKIPAGGAHDAALNTNNASTSTDNSVTWQVADTTKPDVTIDQSNAQADPTSTAPIQFVATFSEPVSGFTGTDVDLSNSTATGTLLPAVTGGPTVYTVSVTGMSGDGKVIAKIPAGAVHDAALNDNNASTSTDNSVTWQQPAIASSVALAFSPTSSVYGQTVTATATVTVQSGTPAGTVQFAVDGTDLGSPVMVSGTTATSSPLKGSGGVALVPGTHTVTASFQPSVPADYAPSSKSADVIVDKATSKTALTVNAHTLIAHVVAVAPGAGVPTGKVSFSVDGVALGALTLSGGTAKLIHTIGAGKTRQVAVAYVGDPRFMASSDSAARHDPTIKAHVTSTIGKHHGWYRTSVHITFTCTTNGAPLTAPCPAPVVLSTSKAAQSVSRTISATNGGMATVGVKGIDIDKVKPTVKVTGVKAGSTYVTPGPALHCTAKDALSSVSSCSISKHAVPHGSGSTVYYVATATDLAGNIAKTSGHYATTTMLISAAPFVNGAYTVHRGHTYLLVVHAAAQPSYYDAAPSPTTPFVFDQTFQPAGKDRWTLPVTMQHKLKFHTYWNLGIKFGGVMHLLKIRAIA